MFSIKFEIQLFLLTRAPISDYALIGFLSVTTMALSNISIQYLNYPTQVCVGFSHQLFVFSLTNRSP